MEMPVSRDNLIPSTPPIPRGVPADFPAMMWKPDGSSYVANSAAEVQPDSTPYHPDSAPAPEAVKAAYPAKPTQPNAQFPLTRKEVVKHLEDGGIDFKHNAPHAVLYGLLLEAVKNALIASEVPFDAESTDAPALLELLPKV